MAAEPELVAEVRSLLWGSAVKEEVFRRWAQGFYFSPDESSALIQDDGGPCAVIAPLQAFILKQLLLELPADIAAWRDLRPESCDKLLVRAMTEILGHAADPAEPKYSILLVDKSSSSNLLNGEVPETATTAAAAATAAAANQVQEIMDVEPNVQQSEAQSSEFVASSVEQQPAIDSKTFHSLLRIYKLGNIEAVEQFLTDNISTFKGQFGILLLLYSVICTKGIAQMRLEISDLTDPLIHSTFGYGSQSLINLMLSGRAVSNVWDHDQNVGGLELKGIDKQNEVGFLTLLETLRYIEVGFFLKSPSHPVWVLGSETHLTVLFSAERKLVSPETRSEQAKRVFKKYDNDGNNFIPTDSLQNVLAELDLFSDSEYVDIIKKKLDRHNDGIILLTSFMYEFFPEDPRTLPDTFVLYHYNGLPRSNPDNKVKYHKGQAILLESAVNSFADNNSMLTVLQTKWPSIEVQWDLNQEPSIN